MVEAYAAKELALCYVHLGVITSYETPRRPAIPAKKAREIFGEMTPKMHKVLEVLIAQLPDKQTCRCSKALEGACRRIDETASPLLARILEDRKAL